MQAFLLFKQAPEASWTQSVRSWRQQYEEHRGRLLKFIKHPEALAEVSVDPLADDPDVSTQSRWLKRGLES